MNKINVLIVDDSLLFRTAVSKGFEEDPALNVVGTANSAEDAWTKILSSKPDVITLDIEMPGMNGIEFLKRFLPLTYIPVVVVSAVSGIVFEALHSGAVDFVAKPSANTGYAVFVQELREKVKIAASAKKSATMRPAMMAAKAASSARSPSSAKAVGSAIPAPPPTIANLAAMAKRLEVIAIGASTGGTEATNTILRSLPGNLPPILITQHMPSMFTKLYAERLHRECAMNVKEAQNGDVLEPGWAYVAPGDYHMKMVRRGKFMVVCEQGPKVSGHCPSVDVLFESVAKTAGSAAVGIILTGMGSDGAKGLLQMKKAGAFTIGQDQKSCVVYGMPMEAHKLGAVDKQVSLENIAGTLTNYIKTGR